MIIFFLDTSSSSNLHVAICDGKTVLYEKNIIIKNRHSDVLIPKIQQIFQNKKSIIKKLKRVRCIAVIKGPGPFSAVRSGVVVANALSYALNIPVVGVKKRSESYQLRDYINDIKKIKRMRQRQFVHPYYGMEPNITKPKK